MISESTRKLMYAMAERIEQHGWCQGRNFGDDGSMCVNGALRSVGSSFFYDEEWLTFESEVGAALGADATARTGMSLCLSEYNDLYLTSGEDAAAWIRTVADQ